MSFLRKLFGADDQPLTRRVVPEAPTPAARQRKHRSELLLKQRGITVPAELPAIESEEQVTLRSAEEVARRALAVATMAAYADDPGSALAVFLMRYEDAKAAFSPRELAFFHHPDPPLEERLAFRGRVESLWTLLWALRHVESLDEPRTERTLSEAEQPIRKNLLTLVARARLRPAGEILDEADLIYRYHWATHRASQRRQPPPAGVLPQVVRERHYALNWLIGYRGQDWDHLTVEV